MILTQHRNLIAATLVLLGSRLATLPRSLWEFDEPLFFEAIWRYEPLHHHPPPPGYPVLVGLAKVLNFFFHDPLASLVALSLLGSVVGFAALSIAFGRLAGDERTGILGAVLFYFSPVMLVHSTLPISDPAALGLFAATLLVATQLLGYGRWSPLPRDAVLFGVLAALTIGCRPQFSIAIVPMVVWLFFVAPGWRLRLLALISFVVACLFWFLPLVFAAGGLARWWAWMGEQASYFATHDAAISRGGRSWIQIVFRFVAHPWGPKWLSFPLLLAAAAGLFSVMRFRSRGFVALALTAIPYLLFAIFMMDPADGPRYALPSLPLVAFLAASGLALASRRWSAAPVTLAVAFCVGAAMYVSTFLAQRGRLASPPVQAAEYAKKTIPPNSVIVYELPLWPHAKLLFKDYLTLRIDDGLRQFSHRPDVPLYLYADGERGDAAGKSFRWIDSDAYGKLTRNHYRVTSFLPIPPTERFRPIQGVYPSERTIIGEQWRWLDAYAEIELPELQRRRVAVTLATSRTFPFDSTAVTILVNGAPAQTLTLKRDQSVEVVLDIPAAPVILGIRPEKSFIPVELPNTLDRDPRRLSVKLLRVRQL